jgi:hypothetical protein
VQSAQILFEVIATSPPIWQIQPMNARNASDSVNASGRYSCTRCGWTWGPRPNSPKPPRACARCRSAYWQSAPTSARGNTPDNPKWQAQRESAEARRQGRRLARLSSRAAELGFRLVPINLPSARTRVLEGQPRIGVPTHSVRFAESEQTERPCPPAPSPAPATPAWRKSW